MYHISIEKHLIIGGLVGLSSGGSISDCKNRGNLIVVTNNGGNSKLSQIGGIIGEGINQCNISKCTNLARIKIENLGQK